MRELTLYSRAGCHLCEQVYDELLQLCAGTGVHLRVCDVDTCAAWTARYGARVPVVCAGEAELTAWPFDRRRVQRWLMG